MAASEPLRPYSDVVANGSSQQLIHRPFIYDIRAEIAVSCFALQQAMTFQVTGNTPRNGVGELNEFIAVRRPDRAKPRTGSIGAIDVNAIRKARRLRRYQPSRAFNTPMFQASPRTKVISGFASAKASTSASIASLSLALIKLI